MSEISDEWGDPEYIIGKLNYDSYTLVPSGRYKVETELPDDWIQFIPTQSQTINSSNSQVDIGIQPVATAGFDLNGDVIIDTVQPDFTDYCRHLGNYFFLSSSGKETRGSRFITLTRTFCEFQSLLKCSGASYKPAPAYCDGSHVGTSFIADV